MSAAADDVYSSPSARRSLCNAVRTEPPSLHTRLSPELGSLMIDSTLSTRQVQGNRERRGYAGGIRKDRQSSLSTGLQTSLARDDPFERDEIITYYSTNLLDVLYDIDTASLATEMALAVLGDCELDALSDALPDYHRFTDRLLPSPEAGSRPNGDALPPHALPLEEEGALPRMPCPADPALLSPFVPPSVDACTSSKRGRARMSQEKRRRLARRRERTSSSCDVHNWRVRSALEMSGVSHRPRFSRHISNTTEVNLPLRPSIPFPVVSTQSQSEAGPAPQDVITVLTSKTDDKDITIANTHCTSEMPISRPSISSQTSLHCPMNHSSLYVCAADEDVDPETAVNLQSESMRKPTCSDTKTLNGDSDNVSHKRTLSMLQHYARRRASLSASHTRSKISSEPCSLPQQKVEACIGISVRRNPAAAIALHPSTPRWDLQEVKAPSSTHYPTWQRPGFLPPSTSVGLQTASLFGSSSAGMSLTQMVLPLSHLVQLRTLRDSVRDEASRVPQPSPPILDTHSPISSPSSDHVL